MPLHHYVTLGRSGLRVSPFCLGAMTFGQDTWGSSVADSQPYELDEHGQVTGRRIDGGAWNEDTVDNMAPVLSRFLRPR